MPFSVFFSMSCGCSCSIAAIQVERKFCSSGNFENYVGRVLKIGSVPNLRGHHDFRDR